MYQSEYGARYAPNRSRRTGSCRHTDSRQDDSRQESGQKVSYLTLPIFLTKLGGVFIAGGNSCTESICIVTEVRFALHLVRYSRLHCLKSLHCFKKYTRWATTPICWHKTRGRHSNQVNSILVFMAPMMWDLDCRWCGLYPLMSLINHSCCPNSLYFYVKDAAMLRASCDLKQG